MNDIELALYDDPIYESNIPDTTILQALQEIANSYQLTYTVHLPMDIGEGLRSLLLAECVITAILPLHPVAYVMHFDGRPLIDSPRLDAILQWQREARHWLAQIVHWVGNPALKISSDVIPIWLMIWLKRQA